MTWLDMGGVSTIRSVSGTLYYTWPGDSEEITEDKVERYATYALDN